MTLTFPIKVVLEQVLEHAIKAGCCVKQNML